MAEAQLDQVLTLDSLRANMLAVHFARSQAEPPPPSSRQNPLTRAKETRPAASFRLDAGATGAAG
eukprot:5518388-Pleurochrysis_carterae.AAC.2